MNLISTRKFFAGSTLSAVALTAVFFCAAPVQPAAAQTSVVEDIIVKVNDQIITRSDLKREREQIMNEIKQQFPTEVQKKFAEHEPDILRDLIDQQLLVQKGKEVGINVDSELIKRLDEMRKGYNLESMEDLEKAAQGQGVSFEDFKANMRNSMIRQQVVGSEVGRHIQVPPSEIAKYYEEHKKEMEVPEAIALAEILVSTDAPALKPGEHKDPEVIAKEESERNVAAEAKANQLLETIKKGAKFDEVAKASSDGPTAKDGGELGEFRRGMLAKELEGKVFPMKSGEVTDVVRTKQGYIILKVVDHRAAGVPPQKEVENQIAETLYMQKLQPALRQYLTKLREEALIDIKAPGVVDTGASPNQTKPIYTASVATQDSDKKKKKEKKK